MTTFSSERLRKARFSADHFAEVQGVYCGDERWSKDAEKWLKSLPSQTTDCALAMINSGTDVWLYYRAEGGELVGFGSLGPRDWRVPTPKDTLKLISSIPWLGIQFGFRGKPDGASRGDRYSDLILDDLIDEARRHPEREPYVGLCVDPEHAAAIKLYLRTGFVKLSRPYVDKETGIAYDRMFLQL